MNGLTFFVGAILPYIAVIVLFVGITYKIFKWTTAAQGKMTLYPASSSPGAKWKRIIKEVLIFQTLFGDSKPLWFGTWIFHASLALIIIGHSRVVTDFPLIWGALGMGKEDVDTMSAVLGGGAGFVILVTGIYLLFRRLVIQRVKEISDWEDYFTLGLVLAIILTGDCMRFITHFDLAQSREYFAALFTFSKATLPADPFFRLHFFLGQVLILYMPFSKFLHIPGVFYSKSIIYQE
jgi:nitrate reductase gamma subunit